MKLLKYCIIVLYSSIICIPFTAFLQNDLLDEAFQPSKNLDHVINIGNNKNAVGNEVFRGSTDIDINATAQCRRIDVSGENTCKAQGESRHRYNNKCYIVPASDIANESACITQGGAWMKGSDMGIEKTIQTSQNAPLLVRITQTLLRLTIALSIPVLIRIGLKLIKNGMTGGDIKEGLKEISGVLLGLMLALSAVGIIYLIQSIATQSLNI